MEKKIASTLYKGQKHENFKRLAEKRTNNILKYLRLLGNLSNTHNYEYSKEEITKIFSVIDNEMKRIKNLFKKPNGEKFKL